MNWDEKAYNEDGRRHETWSGFPCLTDELFTDGAKWQREQLRTPEAIEKAADILSFQTTGGCYPKADEQCRHVMKEVFDALLGED